MKKYFIFLLILAGCTLPKEEEVVIKQLPLCAEPLADMIGLPVQMLIHDSILYVNDSFGDTLVHRYALGDKQPLPKMGVKGIGPGEVQSPLYLFTRNDSLFVFSRPQWTLYYVAEERSDHPRLQKVMKVPVEVSMLFPLPDATCLCSGMFPDKRFILLNSAGEKVLSFGEYPTFWRKEEQFPIEAKRMFHLTRECSFSPTHGLAALSSHVLSLYHYDEKGFLVLKKEVLLSPYEYTSKGKGISTQAKLSPTFISGAKALLTTEERIYILMNPTPKGSETKSNAEIWEYDWEGNLQVKYRPDRNIICWAKGTDGKIWLLEEGETNQVAVWDAEADSSIIL